MEKNIVYESKVSVIDEFDTKVIDVPAQVFDDIETIEKIRWQKIDDDKIAIEIIRKKHANKFSA